ncbi:unnamed protein product, partial [Rotaria sordida]
TTSSPLHSNPGLQAEVPAKSNSQTKKNISKKKKRLSKIKIDLVQQLVGKIEAASESISRSELKVLKLLQKQTQSQ